MNRQQSMEHCIFIDWGTTNVRAFLFNRREARVIDQRQSDKGIKAVARNRFPEVYAELTAGWQEHAAFTLMSGMIGSANGWEEAPYVRLPASVDTIRDHIHRMAGLPHGYIVGGLSVQREDDSYDVMRGEEVQILGLIAKGLSEDQVVCIPGTHCKWLELGGDGTIATFTTVMSGDMFAAICSSTIMAMMLDTPQQFSTEAFSSGLQAAGAPGGVMANLFRVRTARLFDQLDPSHVEAMISGIVIGSELHEMRRLYRTDAPVQRISSASLGQRYSLAFQALGIAHQLHDANTLSLAGLTMLSETITTSSP